MIKPSEIKIKANRAGVRDQQIEKDYILSWILFGISSHIHLSKEFVFKGGTLLKKVYFKNYRFSEDLDFTLLNNEMTNQQIFSFYGEVFELVKSEANIPLEIVDNSEHGDGGVNFYIGYIGPLGGQGANKRIKVDISRSEKLTFQPIIAPVITEYSDLTEHRLLCYSLEEVLVEKMRSVMQRMQSRDFYDIWYLLAHHGMEAGYYLNEFEEKCKNKGLLRSDFPVKLAERLPQYKTRWKGSMSEQIKSLPSFDQVEREINRHLCKLRF